MSNVKTLLKEIVTAGGWIALAKELEMTKREAIRLINNLELGPQMRETRLFSKSWSNLGPVTMFPKMRNRDRIKYRKAAMRAQQRVFRACKAGELAHLAIQFVECADCKIERATCYDHRDYAEPLKVTPVCRWCNMKRGPAILSEKKEGGE